MLMLSVARPFKTMFLIFQTLTANDRGDPSRELNTALVPELRVKKVLYRELGVCEQPQTPVAPPVNPVTPPINFSPILRNPVDHVNATVGELLIYKVKDVSITYVFFIFQITVTFFLLLGYLLRS